MQTLPASRSSSTRKVVICVERLELLETLPYTWQACYVLNQSARKTVKIKALLRFTVLVLGSLAGLVPDVLDAYPEVTIVASKVALAYLKGLTNRSFTERAVKGGDKVSRDIYYCTRPYGISMP